MKSIIPFALSISAAFRTICFAQEPTDLAVVVNKAMVSAEVESGELRQMILGERAKWRSGETVIAVQMPPNSPARELAMKTVYKMSDPALKRYLMLAAFNGKELAQPRDMASATALKKFVASTPGAIGCILASEVDDTVKILKVDGAAPGEPSYKLR